MTHRLFSRNAASSRAIPIDKMMEQVSSDPAMPAQWGLNQAGMQAGEEHNDPMTCQWAWIVAAKSAVESAKTLQRLGLHKQIVNRVLEPFQMMKTVVTATEFDNMFWLRCHPDAVPEFNLLADLMLTEYRGSTPSLLKDGMWHLPYVEWYVLAGEQRFLSDEITTLEEAQKVSASCCAQVSFRMMNESLDVALRVYDKLVSSVPVHASPFEHQAAPIGDIQWEFSLDGTESTNKNMPEGITHEDREGYLWSGNLRGFIQYRQLIKGNACWNYEETI